VVQASECCIIRVAIAAVLGWLIAVALLWQKGILTVLLLSPFAGSAAAIAAILLFWLVSLFVPCRPSAR
jgi:hypothetical protein